MDNTQKAGVEASEKDEVPTGHASVNDQEAVSETRAKDTDLSRLQGVLGF